MVTPSGISNQSWALPALGAFYNTIPGSLIPTFRYHVWRSPEPFISVQWPTDLPRLPPAQWHQWLRYTRTVPPSISEQQADALRQRELKHLVQAADARWAAKPSLLDKPRPRKVFGIPVNLRGNSNREVGEAAGPREKQKEYSGQTWQPDAWLPEHVKK